MDRRQRIDCLLEPAAHTVGVDLAGKDAPADVEVSPGRRSTIVNGTPNQRSSSSHQRTSGTGTCARHIAWSSGTWRSTSVLPERRTPLGGMRITSASTTAPPRDHVEAERQAGVARHRRHVGDRDLLVVAARRPVLELGVQLVEVDPRCHGPTICPDRRGSGVFDAGDAEALTIPVRFEAGLAPLIEPDEGDHHTVVRRGAVDLRGVAVRLDGRRTSRVSAGCPAGRVWPACAARRRASPRRCRAPRGRPSAATGSVADPDSGPAGCTTAGARPARRRPPPSVKATGATPTAVRSDRS